MPSFAVVVPTFNREQLLPATLDSVLGQTRPFDQVIVVDDASSDGTAEVMASRYPACQFIALPQRHMQQGTRNAGIAVVASDWVVFLDSDDLLVADYLARLIELIGRHPDVNVIYTNHSVFSERGIQIPDKFAEAPAGLWDEQHDDDTAYIGGGPPIAAKLVWAPGLLWPSGLAVKRPLLDIIGWFDERMAGVPGEDFEFTLRAVAGGRVAFIKAPLVQIREHPQNFSRVDPMKRLRGRIQLLQFSLANHPHARTDPLRQALIGNIERVRRHYLFESFRLGQWEAVRQMGADLSDRPLSAKERLKVVIAHLPGPLRYPLHVSARLMKP